MRRRRSMAGVLAAVCALAIAGVPTGAAAEAAAPDPLWYVDAMRIDAIHDAGITGEGVTIAVFDDKLDPDFTGLRNVDLEVRTLEGCPDPTVGAATDFEGARHGTSVAALIAGVGESDSGAGPVGVAPGVRIIYYGILTSDCGGEVFPAAIDDAVAQGADIVTFSGYVARLTDELTAPTVQSVRSAVADGMIIVAAMPNADSLFEGDLERMNGVVNVAAADSAAQPATDTSGAPMRYEDVDVVAPGVDVAGVGFDGTWGLSSWSGTSAATPLVAGVLALAKQKWPDATSNQLLQSLIRNTGSQPHELTWGDALGHGVVNATRMMEEDPSQYPDENPLFKDDQLPAYDDVYPESEPTATPKPAADAGLSVLPWVIGGGVVVVVGVVMVIVVLGGRRKKGERSDV